MLRKISRASEITSLTNHCPIFPIKNQLGDHSTLIISLKHEHVNIQCSNQNAFEIIQQTSLIFQLDGTVQIKNKICDSKDGHI